MGYPHNLIAERVNFTRPAGSRGTIQANRCDGITSSAGTSHLHHNILDEYGWRVGGPSFWAISFSNAFGYAQAGANQLNVRHPKPPMLDLSSRSRMSEGKAGGRCSDCAAKRNSIEIFPFLALRQVIDLPIPINKITLATIN